VLDISVKEVGYQKYQITLNNFFMPLPLDIGPADKTTRTMIGKEGIVVSSNGAPQVDAKGHYLKKITIQ